MYNLTLSLNSSTMQMLFLTVPLARTVAEQSLGQGHNPSTRGYKTPP